MPDVSSEVMREHARRVSVFSRAERTTPPDFHGPSGARRTPQDSGCFACRRALAPAKPILVLRSACTWVCIVQCVSCLF
jgi:hypothetical protein